MNTGEGGKEKKKEVFKELVYAGRTAEENRNTEGFSENKQEQMIDKAGNNCKPLNSEIKGTSRKRFSFLKLHCTSITLDFAAYIHSFTLRLMQFFLFPMDQLKQVAWLHDYLNKD